MDPRLHAAPPAGMASAAQQPPPEPRAGKGKKRPAAEPPRDQLPYQRRQSFRCRAFWSLEDRVHELLEGYEDLGELRVSIGRLQMKESNQKLFIPTCTEVVVDPDAHSFEPSMSKVFHEALRAELDERLRCWSAEPAGAARRWVEVKVEELEARAAAAPAQALTVYCPWGSWHYCVELGSGAAATRGEGPLFKETRYTFRKEESPTGLHWAVSLLSGIGENADQCRVELRVNNALLTEQRTRLNAGKVHSFSLLVRDLLRNARDLVRFLRTSTLSRADAESLGQAKQPAGKGLEPSKVVLQHYATKAERLAQQGNKLSESSQVRRYNNLIKVLLIERFIDPLPEPIRVLDLGCGMGQDVQKYSQAFRGAKMQRYVGVDFAPAAVKEAQQRYLELKQRRRGGAEYSAIFHAGDVRSAETFQWIFANSQQEPFDVVTMQFMLQYLAQSEETVRLLLERIAGLLRPGGFVIGTIPSCEALADLFAERAAAAAAAAAGGEAKVVGKRLYSIRFEGASWDEASRSEERMEEAFTRRWGMAYAFSLQDAVDAQEEYVIPWEAFEQLAEGAGFRVVLDAPFRDVLEGYKGKSRFFHDIFSPDARNLPLAGEELEVFNLYSSFVLERVSAAAPLSSPSP